MHIHILQVTKARGIRSNKDTNGGYGTVNDFGQGLVSRGLKYLKNRMMNFPEILPAYIHAILKLQGHTVTYAENKLDDQAEMVLLQTSIINYYEELEWAKKIKENNPNIRVGFVGGMSAGNPDLYKDWGDFVITGEVENALLQRDIEHFNEVVEGGLVIDLDSLPFPDWSHINQWRDRYGFFRTKRGRTIPILSSRGCPMACRYYCTYPLIQGTSYRSRSPQNIIEEISYLIQNYGLTTVLFRDPIFTYDMPRVEKLCHLIHQSGLRFNWICETHPRYLNPKLIELMGQAGCIAVKLGIEARNIEVMQKSHRIVHDLSYQEDVIRCLESHQIDVLSFYILGYFDDDEKTINQTINYAISLNTFGAQFAIATPYPGTPWYGDMKNKPESIHLDDNLEDYSQYRLVYNHPHLSSEDMERLKSLAYRRYYFRLSFLSKHFRRIM
jgi:radical SAM superfamily enzyme YgiQ (UPF0313 family)